MNGNTWTGSPHFLREEIQRWTTKRYKTISLLYLAIGTVWIFLSGIAAGLFFKDPAILARIEALKGFGFVLVTASALFLILKKLDTAYSSRFQTAGHILDNLREGIILYGPDDRLMSMNKAARSILGLTEEESRVLSKETLARLRRSIFDESGRPVAIHEMASSLARDSKLPMSGTILRIVRNDGSWVWAEVKAVPVPEDLICGPTPESRVAVAVSMADISEKKVMQDRIAESEKVFRTLLESAPIGIGVVDGSRTLKWCNPYMGWLTGVELEELQGSSTQVLYFNREEYERSGWDLYRLLEQRVPVGTGQSGPKHPNGGRAWSDRTHPDTAWSESLFVGPGKNPVDVLISLTILPSDQGALEYLCTVTDITRAKRAEEELRRSHEEMEQRVLERTSELSRANESLSREVGERKRSERREQDRNEILTALASGEDLGGILNLIVEYFDAENPEWVCSILMVDDSGKRLLHGAAHNLPEFYNKAINGLRIGEDVVSFGRAAHTGRIAVTDDIRTDPSWDAFRDQAERAFLRACWAVPVFSAKGRVVAVFAVYCREPRKPRDEDLERIKMAAGLVSLAIERKHSEDALQKSHEDLEERVKQRTAELTRANEALRAEVDGRKRAEQKVSYMSFHDSLTGLFNRNSFDEEMTRFPEVRQSPAGIMVCDVNGLKLVNDTFGHERGDELLVQTARFLRNSFRSGDILARVGGDEFAVLMERADESIMEELVDGLRKTVDEHNREAKIHVSLSVGWAVSERTPPDVASLFKIADNRMYREKMQRKESFRSHIVQALMKALEARDFVTQGHCDRLHQLVMPLAREQGLSEDVLNDLGLLARFHDLGKVGVPDNILNKPGKLTDEEFDRMRKHSEMGHRIAQSVPDLAPIADLILKHHEWWDGRGYPLGLAGESIPLSCRILFIADAYDAMTEDRPYRKAMDSGEAIEELQRCAGTQFDPDLVAHFIDLLPNMQVE